MKCSICGADTVLTINEIPFCITCEQKREDAKQREDALNESEELPPVFDERLKP